VGVFLFTASTIDISFLRARFLLQNKTIIGITLNPSSMVFIVEKIW
jgi:hypothetical protein